MPTYSFNVSTINGTNGFVFANDTTTPTFGFSVSGAGDVNGDGYDDVLVSDYIRGSTGQSFLIFGSNGMPASLTPASLTGPNGYRLDGLYSSDHTGFSVSEAGDFNGDGFDDFMIGARHGQINAGYNGDIYVVFGRDGITTPFTATDALFSNTNADGFRINAAGINDSHDFAGASVSSAGDFNGDGFDDLLIGAYGWDDTGEFEEYRGQAYVVFGNNGNATTSLSLGALTGANGFSMSGIDLFDRLGVSVSTAGDLNGDNIDDIFIAASGADNAAGEFYVIFGTTSAMGANFDLTTLNGTNGFTLHGIDSNDHLTTNTYQAYTTLSDIGDFNGDGIDDLAIGAHYGDPNGVNSGEIYVIYGSNSGYSADIYLSALNGTNGFTILGEAAGSNAGFSISGSGDYNGDGYDDLLIGGRDVSGGTGEAYILFGDNGAMTATLDLAVSAFSITGFGASSNSNFETIVSHAGDVNNDGIDDIIIGSADSGSAGEAYIIYGDCNFSNPATSSVIAPVIYTIGTGTYVYEEHDGATQLSNTLTLGDADSTQLTAASVTIATGFDAANDSLSFTALGTITGSYDAVTGILSLSGTASLADYQTVLQSVSYTNAFTTPSIALREFDFLVYDDVNVSASATRSFSMKIDETITGTPGADTLYGDWGSDTLYGLLSADNLYGGADDDFLEGGGGGDLIDGGAGFDMALYVSAPNSVIVNLITGAASGSHASGDTLISIEGLLGSAQGDTLTGNAGDNKIYGQGGNDILGGFKGDDLIYGEDGNDIISGGAGADNIDGGNGIDMLRYNGSNAAVQVDLLAGIGTGGHAQGDIIAGIEKLIGSTYGDTLTGDFSNNRIFGLNGDDAIWARGGNDKVWGGNGADTFIFKQLDFKTRVMDFEDDIDKIDLSDFGYGSLAAVLNDMTQINADVRYDDGAGNKMFINDITIADLSDDIIF